MEGSSKDLYGVAFGNAGWSGAVKGMNVLLYSNDATVKVIDPNGTDHIWLNGVDLGAGITMQSPGAIGDYIVLVAFSNNNWYTIGQSGTWIVTP